MLTFLDLNVILYFKFSNLGVSRIGGWSGFFGCGLGVPEWQSWELSTGVLGFVPWGFWVRARGSWADF